MSDLAPVEIGDGLQLRLVERRRRSRGDRARARRPADRITPVVAKNDTVVLARKAPSSVRNSPTKPEVPGRPTLAMVKTMNATA